MSGTGHNSQVTLSENERKALFIVHAADIEKLTKAMNEANAKLRNAFGQAKTDGFEKKTLKEYLRLKDMSTDDLTAELREQALVLKWSGHGAQLDIEDLIGSPKAGSAVRNEGFRAGTLGEPAECDYTQSAQRKEWLEGYHEGQAARNANDARAAKAGTTETEGGLDWDVSPSADTSEPAPQDDDGMTPGQRAEAEADDPFAEIGSWGDPEPAPASVEPTADQPAEEETKPAPKTTKAKAAPKAKPATTKARAAKGGASKAAE